MAGAAARAAVPRRRGAHAPYADQALAGLHPDSQLRATALLLAGFSCLLLGDPPGAEPTLATAFDIAMRRRASDPACPRGWPARELASPAARAISSASEDARHRRSVLALT
jgi:hypothetical protein